jgi:phage portal protein BeeE
METATSTLGQGLARHLGGIIREFRSSLENPQVPLNFPAEWMLDIFNGGRTDSGVRVSEMTALQVATVYTCVNIISNAVAGLPFNIYEHKKSGPHFSKTLARDNELWEILRKQPNPEMTAFTFLKTFMCHALLWGNAYAEIEGDSDGTIKALWLRNPARTRPVRLTQPMQFKGDLLPRGTLMFETSESLLGNEPVSGTDNPEMNWGTRRLVHAEDMLHVPGLSLDGRLGQSTTYLGRQVIGLALATEKYAAKFFGNGARPAGVLTMPAKMEDKAIDTLRRSWAESHGGENQHKVAVLEAGVKYEKIAATPDEGQMGNTRQYQRDEIAAIFNVPQHMVGTADTGRQTTEQHSLEFIMYCLRPWLTAIEQEFSRKLFSDSDTVCPKFDTRMLIYPDSESRSKFYASGRQWGYLTANQIAELEDMNPTPDASGDTYMVQANMVNMKAMLLPLKPPTKQTPPASAPGQQDEPADGQGENEGLSK